MSRQDRQPGRVAGNGRDYTPYTPTLTANGTPVTMGNGSIVGEWRRDGNNRVHGLVQIVVGSTSNFLTGSLGITLPVPEATSWAARVGDGYFNDVSGNIQYLFYAFRNTEIRFRVHGVGGELDSGAAVPVVMATGDSVLVELSYKAT